jgi:exosome complex component RRP40
MTSLAPDNNVLTDQLLKEVTSTIQFQPQVVLAGDIITHIVKKYVTRVVVIGNGLMQVKNPLNNDTDEIQVVQPGILRFESPGTFWVETNEKRYQPKIGDPVVGIIEQKLGMNGYLVNVNGRCSAFLPLLEFDGASKRNHPNLKEGTLIYARLASDSIYVEPELSCKVKSGVRKDWMTGEAYYGKLENGISGNCSLHLARKLLNDNCKILKVLSSRIPFEIAVGINGRFWVCAQKNDQTILIYNAILNSEFFDNDLKAVEAMVEELNIKLAQR